MELVPQHLFSSEMEMLLIFSIGIFWILTYSVLIYRGFKDQRCGMPFAALCGNLTWEFIYSFVFPHSSPQIYMLYIWFGLDVVIFYQFIRFSRDDLPDLLSNRFFIPSLILSLIIPYGLNYSMALEFSDFFGVYSAFGLNVMMSTLFIVMLFRRDNTRGQSMSIAVLKCIGTGSASLLGYSYFPFSVLLMTMFVTCFLLDVLYGILLYWRVRRS